MTSPVKEANSDRHKMKAAEADVKLTFRKTLTFDCVQDDTRVRISGTENVVQKLKSLSDEEYNALKVVELVEMMKSLELNGCQPDGFVWDMENENVGKDTTQLNDHEFVIHFTHPNMKWPKIECDPMGPNFTVTIGRESCQIYLQFLGYGKGGNRNFKGNKPNWWPANVPHQDSSTFTASECDLFIKGISSTFNLPPNHFRNLVVHQHKKRKTLNVADDRNLED